MRATPTFDMQALLSVVQTLDANPTDAAPALLARACRALHAAVPGARAVRAYLADATLFHPVADGDQPAEPPLAHEDAPDLAEALRRHDMVVDARRQRMVTALINGAGHALGVLLVDGDDTTLTAEAGVRAVARTLGLAIGERQEREALSQMRQQQAFAERVIRTSTALAGARDDDAALARVVLGTSDAHISTVALALFNRPFSKMGVPSRLSTRVVVGRDGATATDVAEDVFAPEEDARVTYFLDQLLGGRMMLLWNAERPRRPVLAASLVSALEARGDVFVSAFGLNTVNGLSGLLVLGSTLDLRQTPTEAEALRATADQLTAALETRISVAQATRQATLLRARAEATSAIVRATHAQAVLEAVFIATGQDYRDAQLALRDAQEQWHPVAATSAGASAPLQPVDYPALRTLEALEMLEVRNSATDNFITDDERAQLIRRNIGALLLLPLRVAQHTIGLIALTDAQPRQLSADKLRMLRAVADSATDALLRVRQGSVMSTGMTSSDASLQPDASTSLANDAAPAATDANTLEVLHHLAQGLAAAPDATTMLASAARALVQGTGVDHAGIVLLESPEGDGVVRGEYPSRGFVGGVLAAADNPIVQRLLVSAEPVVVNDVPTSPLLAEDNRRALLASGVQAMLALPLQDPQGTLFGTVGLDVQRAGHVFDATQQHIAQTIVALVAHTLHIHRQLSAERHRADQLLRVNTFAQRVQGQNTLDAVLRNTLEVVPLVTQAALLDIVLSVPGASGLVRAARADHSSTPPRHEYRLTPNPVEDETLAYVVRSGQLLLLRDEDAATALARAGLPAANTLLLLPLRARGEAVGALRVVPLRGHGYTDADLALFQQLLSPLALAVYGARTYTETQRHARARALSDDLSVLLQTQQDLPDMLNATVTRVGGVLRARRARVRLGAPSNTPPTHPSGT